MTGRKTASREIDILRVMQLLPHRYPFLMVDRIIDVVPGTSATGIKNVTVNEPHFQGHFPQKPVMPGVLIIEAMAQTAGALVVETLGEGAMGKLVYFMVIELGALPQAGGAGRRAAYPCPHKTPARQCLEIRRPGEGRRRFWSPKRPTPP